MTTTEEKSNAATLPHQFGLRAVFAAMTVVALALAPIVAIQRAMYRSPHQRAIDSVNGLDGWAREEADGYVVADLNGGTCPIHDESLKKLVDCQRLRKLTAYQTQLTDAGLHYLRVHKDLRILHLDDCTAWTAARHAKLVSFDSNKRRANGARSPIALANLLSGNINHYGDARRRNPMLGSVRGRMPATSLAAGRSI